MAAVGTDAKIQVFHDCVCFAITVRAFFKGAHIEFEDYSRKIKKKRQLLVQTHKFNLLMTVCVLLLL